MLKSLGLGLLCTDEVRAVATGPVGVTQSPLRTSFCISQDSLEEQNFHGVKIYYEGDILDACTVGLGSLTVTVYIVKG